MARHIRQVALDDQTYDVLMKLREANGMTQKELMTRVLEWVAALDVPAQQLVLGRLPAEYVQDAVKRLADNAVDIAIHRRSLLSTPAPKPAVTKPRRTANESERLAPEESPATDPSVERNRRTG